MLPNLDVTDTYRGIGILNPMFGQLEKYRRGGDMSITPVSGLHMRGAGPFYTGNQTPPSSLIWSRMYCSASISTSSSTKNSTLYRRLATTNAPQTAFAISSWPCGDGPRCLCHCDVSSCLVFSTVSMACYINHWALLFNELRHLLHK